MRLVLIILFSALYVFNFEICNFVYPDDSNEWWKLRQEIYCLMFVLLASALNIGATGKLRLFCNIMVSLILSDLIDRIFFDITTYEWKDILTIILTLSTSFYVWKYKTN